MNISRTTIATIGNCTIERVSDGKGSPRFMVRNGKRIIGKGLIAGGYGTRSAAYRVARRI